MKGGYLLVLENSKDRFIKVGKRGIHFKKGYYIYCGSGMANLEKRVKRHFTTNKKLKWNIDYISIEMRPEFAFLIPSIRKIECELSILVGKIFAEVDGFGSSDCDCDTHLYYSDQNPLQKLKVLLKNKYSFELIGKEKVI